MADLAIENALTARRELQEKIKNAESQIAEWRERLDRANRFIHDWEEFSGTKVTENEQGHTALIKKRSSGPADRPKNPKKEDVAQLARDILLENGMPMSRDKLFAAISDRGMVIQGKKPPVVFQTMLWRMQSVITHLKGFGYWPTDVAYGLAAYDPNNPELDAKFEELL